MFAFVSPNHVLVAHHIPTPYFYCSKWQKIKQKGVCQCVCVEALTTLQALVSESHRETSQCKCTSS